MSKLLDLTGRQFGYLKVVRRCGVESGKRAMWVCFCSCERDGCLKEIEIPRYNLLRKRNAKVDCGCQLKQKTGICGDCNISFTSPRLRVCHDGVLRCKKCTKRHTPMQREYDLTLTGYNRLLERQGGVCAICKNPPKEGRSLAIDHDHATDQVRGLLCLTCNLMLGYAKDNLTLLRSVFNYLLRNGKSRDWDDYFLDIASLVSTRSKDMSTQCGAVIVKDRNVLSTGYNGFPRGWNDSDPQNQDRPRKYILTIHSEVNALLNAARSGIDTRGATLYVTPIPPCHECAKSIIQAGILKVVARVSMENTRWQESNATAKEFFDECGLLYEEIKL